MSEMTVEELVNILSVKDYQNYFERRNAAKELGNRRDVIAVPVLIEALLDFENDDWVAGDAATALGQIKDAQAVKPLIEVLFSPILDKWIADIWEEAKDKKADRYSYALGYGLLDIDMFRGEILKALQSIATVEALKAIEEWENKHPEWKVKG